MANHKDVGLFIPTFNVANQIGPVLRKLNPELLKGFKKIYFIDNGSRDETIEIVKTWSASQSINIAILQNCQNVLLGGSTRQAFDLAIGDSLDYLICMHSDGQAEPADLSQFLSALAVEDFDFLLGSRFLPQSHIAGYSRLRYLFNLFFALLQQTLLKKRVYDLGAFVGFNLKTISNLPYSSLPYDMGYHPYLILTAALYQDLHFKEFPISWGRVETTNVNVWKYGIVHLARIIKLHAGFVPKEPGKPPVKSQKIA